MTIIWVLVVLYAGTPPETPMIFGIGYTKYDECMADSREMMGRGPPIESAYCKRIVVPPDPK